MESERDQLIRQRAYLLWEEEGRPEGQAEQFWLKAERSLGGDHDTPSAADALAASIPAAGAPATPPVPPPGGEVPAEAVPAKPVGSAPPRKPDGKAGKPSGRAAPPKRK